MGILKNQKNQKNSKMLSIKKYEDMKKLIFFMVVVFVIFISLLISLYFTINTIKTLKKREKYVSQIQQLKEDLEISDNEEKEKKNKLPELTEVGKNNLNTIYKSDSKRAFITFDDGPSKNTEQILDILKENDIKAAFFVLGSQIKGNENIIKRMYEEGHYIGNHGCTHVYSKIYMSPENVLEEYQNCNQLVADALGIPEYNSHLFRFPGGSVGGKYQEIKNKAIELLDSNNIGYVDWNALTGDSEKTNPTEDYIINSLIRTTGVKNSVVVLMHDALEKAITVTSLQKVINYLKQQGYEFQDFYDVIK